MMRFGSEGNSKYTYWPTGLACWIVSIFVQVISEDMKEFLAKLREKVDVGVEVGMEEGWFACTWTIEVFSQV